MFLMGKKRLEQLEVLKRMKGDQVEDPAESKASDAFLEWRSTLSVRVVSRLRKTYAIPNNVSICIPGKMEGATPSAYNSEVAVYDAMFKAELNLLLNPPFRRLLAELNLAPSQIKPTRWVLLVSFCILWKMAQGRDANTSVIEFLSFYRPTNYREGWSFQGHPHFIKMPERWHAGDDYEWSFFFISSVAWELNVKERYLDTPPIVLVVWGVPRKSYLGVPPSLSQTEKYNIGAVRKWVKEHPYMLDVGSLLTRDNLECLMGHPQGKWSNPLATRVAGQEDILAKPLIRVEKRKVEVEGGVLLTKKPRPQPREGSSESFQALEKNLSFATPRPQIRFKTTPPREVKKEVPSPGETKRKMLVAQEPATVFGVVPVVVDLDSPIGESPAKERVDAPSQRESPAINVAPLSFAAPLGGCLALTWRGETAPPEASVDDRGRKARALPTLTPDDFTEAVESLSHLVQEIASQVESTPEALRETTITDKEEVGNMLMPPLKEGKGTGEHSCEASWWWIIVGFLANPCVTLASVLPAEMLASS
jgi:hypothetical protein